MTDESVHEATLLFEFKDQRDLRGFWKDQPKESDRFFWRDDRVEFFDRKLLERAK